jgi:hypothetical protein
MVCAIRIAITLDLSEPRMTIAGFDDEALTSVLRENLTPSDFIRTPERLFGRDKHLRTIERALNSAERQIFIYGDRGVGKTSLALTAAYLHTPCVIKRIGKSKCRSGSRSARATTLR